MSTRPIIRVANLDQLITVKDPVSGGLRDITIADLLTRSVPEATAAALPTSGSLVLVYDGTTREPRTLSAAVLLHLYGLTAGEVTASRAVVVDANKDVTGFRHLSALTLNAGESGAIGLVEIFPATAGQGKAQISCNDQAADTTVAMIFDQMGQPTNIVIPDPGVALADFVLSEGDQDVSGVKAFTNFQRRATEVTPTVNGTGTGLIPVGASYVTIQFADPDFQAALPAAEAGDKITIYADNACELISSVAGTKANGVLIGSTNELALTTGNLYHCEYVTSNTWIIRGVDGSGADLPALVPDAI